jgi:dTDP-4-dehydrorhamnose 3,5-epimerase
MTDLNLDETVLAARRDLATVASSGKSLAKVISGVLTNSPVNHVDHRGRVFEVYPGPSEHWVEPLVYAYVFTVRAGQTKGWAIHEHKSDRYTLVTGEVLTVLFDARLDSPTHGLEQRINLSGEGVRQLVIPQGVWHMNINIGESEAYLISHPTTTYSHDAPDRLLLPWDTKEIPVDVSDYFPTAARPARVS